MHIIFNNVHQIVYWCFRIRIQFTAQTPHIIRKRQSDQFRTQIIGVGYPIVARFPVDIPDDRHTHISHRHEAEQVTQERTFADGIIFCFAQFDADTDYIGQRRQPLEIFITPVTVIIHKVDSHISPYMFARYQRSDHQRLDVLSAEDGIFGFRMFRKLIQ